MENEDLKSLFDIQISDLHNLQSQGFYNVCTVKKCDVHTNTIVPCGFTLTYWYDSNMISLNLVLEDSGKYTIKCRGTTIKSHVPVDKVKQTLDKYKIKVLKHEPYVVIERLKARRRN